MDQVAVTVFGLAGLLGLISLLPPVAERLGVPYTVLLAALGCALGAAVGFDLSGLGLVGDFLHGLGGIAPTAAVFLTVFLPVLLFETALGIDTRGLLEDLGPILLLAVVAVVVTTLVAGFAVWGAALGLTTGLTLAGALLLASIVATTDPIAVVAVFREVGAPQRLSNLVEGESLLNDAAAIALFGLFLAVVTGLREPDLAEGVLSFLWGFLGGSAFGFVAGRAAAALVTRLSDVSSAEITLSLALPYLTFVLAQWHLGVSGVVAVVVAALAFGAYGRVRVAPANWQALTAIWQQLSFWASSLIFVLASMLVPHALQGLTAADGFLLLVLVAAALLARALVLYGLLPALSLLGFAQRVSGAYKAVMLWGGLRGAVTLALALAVAENALVPAGIKHEVALLATGFVLFTLFVQAPTLPPLLRWLGLDRLPATERALRARVMALSFGDIADRLHAAAEAYRVGEEPAREVEGRYRERQTALGDGGEATAWPVNQLYIGLGSLGRREAELYRQHFDERMVSRRIAARLARQAAALLDGLKTGGPSGYAAVALALDGFDGRRFRLALWLHDRLRIDRPLARRLSDQFEILLVRGKVLRELRTFNHRSLRPLLGETVALELDRALAGRLEAAETGLAALRLQYPDYGGRLGARYLARAALRMEDATYRRLYEESVIGREVFNSLMRDLRARRREADREPKLDLGMEVRELVRRVPLFAALDEGAVREIAGMLRPRLTVPGELLVRRGARGDRMFFIASGAVEVEVPPRPVRLGTGDFFGELALLNRQPRTADVRAIGYGKLLTLEGRDFRRFLRAHPDLRAHVLEVARERQGLRRRSGQRFT